MNNSFENNSRRIYNTADVEKAVTRLAATDSAVEATPRSALSIMLKLDRMTKIELIRSGRLTKDEANALRVSLDLNI